MKAIWFNQLDFASLCKTSRLELAASFSRMGHRLTIVAMYRGKRPPLAPVNPRPLLLKQYVPDPAGGLFFQLQVFLLTAFGILRKVDAILVDHFCAMTMFPFNLLSRAGLIRTKFLLDVRSAPVEMGGIRYTMCKLRYTLSMPWVRLFYDGITTITDLYRKDIASRFRMDPTSIGVWTSGVRADIFDPGRVDKADVHRIKSRLALGDTLVMMYHGVLSPYRGLQEVVKALALLKAEGNHRTVFVVLGDGPAAAEIVSLAETQGVRDAVRLVGSVAYEKVPEYLSICDVGILPYADTKWLNMNSPLKLLEYLSMGKPVVVTDISAHRSVLGDSRCAFYITDNSPVNIARTVRKLAELKGILPQMGKQGRKIVLERFSWDIQARNLLDYIAGLNRRKGK